MFRRSGFAKWVTFSVAVGAAILGLCAADPAPAGAQVQPPCVKRALTRGLSRGETPFPDGRLVRPWACAGRFAYAAVIFDGNELTVLFRAVGRRWQTADRTAYCPDVPSRIWQPACNTN